MSAPALTLTEVAHELGRSADWLSGAWRGLVKSERMPRPLHTTPPLMWSRAQIYAWLDRDLTREQRIAAAAYRAAEAAALAATGQPAGPEASAIALHQQRLNSRFVKA